MLGPGPLPRKGSPLPHTARSLLNTVDPIPDGARATLFSSRGHREREKNTLQAAKQGALGRKKAGEGNIPGRVYQEPE